MASGRYCPMKRYLLSRAKNVSRSPFVHQNMRRICDELSVLAETRPACDSITNIMVLPSPSKIHVVEDILRALFSAMTEFTEATKLLRSSRSEQRAKTFLITGCSSGIGLQAATLLGSASPDSRFILVARNQESAEYAKQQLQHSSVSDENIIPMVCDHSSFTSIRNFCDDLRKRLAVLNSCGIDVMCLNAAILMGEEAGPHFTEDGFEITFQTNHLAPFLIANLSYDLLNPGSRVVVTTSGLYAFSTFQNFVGITDPETGKVRKNFETINGEAFHYKKNYSASKLCNIAFGAELNRRLQKKDSLAVCFSPGLITSTGLFRRQKGGWQDTIDKKKAIGMNETKEWGGSVLAWMALSDEAGKRGGEFWRAPYGISQRGGSPEKDLYSEPTSEEASDPLIQNKLWRLSAELTGISSDLI